MISEWHPTLYAAAHNLDPSYDQYLPIFMLSAFVNFYRVGYIWFALHDYNADMPSGLFTSSASNPEAPAADDPRHVRAHWRSRCHQTHVSAGQAGSLYDHRR